MPIEFLTGDAVSVRVEAPSERVYELIVDLERMGEWSPECTRCEWTDGATGPVKGARFKAWNRRGFLRWSNKPTVVAAEPGREFAFSRKTRGAGEVIWRYRLEPDGDATTLTEAYEIVKDAAKPLIWVTLKLMRLDDREGDLREGMRSTLNRIKAAAESS